MKHEIKAIFPAQLNDTEKEQSWTYYNPYSVQRASISEKSHLKKADEHPQYLQRRWCMFD